MKLFGFPKFFRKLVKYVLFILRLMILSVVNIHPISSNPRRKRVETPFISNMLNIKTICDHFLPKIESQVHVEPVDVRARGKFLTLDNDHN